MKLVQFGNADCSGDIILINPDSIVMVVEISQERTNLYLSTGLIVAVQESPRMIIKAQDNDWILDDELY